MNLIISKLHRAIRAAAHANPTTDIFSYTTGECALGQVLVARTVKGVCAILIGAVREVLEADVAARFPQTKLVPNETHRPL